MPVITTRHTVQGVCSVHVKNEQAKTVSALYHTESKSFKWKEKPKKTEVGQTTT